MIKPNTLGNYLQAADRAQVISTANALLEGWSMNLVQPSESGLALLKWRDAVKHQLFFMGEVPITRAAISLTDADGQRVEGGAVIMRDDIQLAQAIAVLDAVCRNQLAGSELVESLALTGLQAQAVLHAQRQSMLVRTRVDFSLLSETEEQNHPVHPQKNQQNNLPEDTQCI